MDIYLICGIALFFIGILGLLVIVCLPVYWSLFDYSNEDIRKSLGIIEIIEIKIKRK